MNTHDTRGRAAAVRALAEQGVQPVVTVAGKYNHGKSRLLNELVDASAFAVADRRETAALSSHVHEQVRWLDVPGLDADVDSADVGAVRAAGAARRRPARAMCQVSRLVRDAIGEQMRASLADYALSRLRQEAVPFNCRRRHPCMTLSAYMRPCRR